MLIVANIQTQNSKIALMGFYLTTIHLIFTNSLIPK